MRVSLSGGARIGGTRQKIPGMRRFGDRQFIRIVMLARAEGVLDGVEGKEVGSGNLYDGKREV